MYAQVGVTGGSGLSHTPRAVTLLTDRLRPDSCRGRASFANFGLQYMCFRNLASHFHGFSSCGVGGFSTFPLMLRCSTHQPAGNTSDP